MKIGKKATLLLVGVVGILAVGYFFYFLPDKQNPIPLSQGMEKISYESRTLQEGNGVLRVKPGDRVAVNYIGALEDDTIFSSSLASGMPFEVFIGRGEAPLGWDEGLIGMKIGEKRKITVPSDYAGSGIRQAGAAEGAVLYYEVEIVDIR